MKCALVAQGFQIGSCLVQKNGQYQPACRLTLRSRNGELQRLITSIHLSRPENYLSIYQSGCNFACKKCHSWYFSKNFSGHWYSPAEIAQLCQQYEKKVTLVEPREKATSWHAHDSCRCRGWCIIKNTPSAQCPRILEPRQIALSPQGWGPARNIVAFTGGDLTCRPQFYVECARLIKETTKLWILIETNGFGLTPRNLDVLKENGVDAFWLDIKAFDNETHHWLTGCYNHHILGLPGEIIKRGFVLEVLSLYIPTLVEADQIKLIAEKLAAVDTNIPFTILAFFPEYKMKNFRSATVWEMIAAFEAVKSTGLRNVRLGNTGVFAHRDEDYELLNERVGAGCY